jgi:IS30 family transposase
MTANIPCLPLPEINIDELTTVSDRWVESAKEKIKPVTKLDIVRTLEPGITALINSGYTYKAVCEKLKEDLHLDISVSTVRVYLQKIYKEQKQDKAKTKRTAGKAARESKQKSISGSVEDEQPVTNLSSSNAEIKPKSIVPKIHPVDDDDFNDDVAQSKILKYFNR